eukprot:3607947-Pleurochrysis_carterae.AAC.1
MMGETEGLGIPSCSALRLSRAVGLGGFAGLRGGMTPSLPDAVQLCFPGPRAGSPREARFGGGMTP